MTLRKLITGLVVTFAVPWLLLIVFPYASLAKLQPVAYSEEDGDAAKGYFPPQLASYQARGQKVYFDEGCAQCHTQVIRPQYIGGDGDEFKRGWGGSQQSASPARTRASTPYDYLGEDFAAIGLRRNGPDLSNAAYRFTSRADILQQLYDPRVAKPWSICPRRPHLFTERKVQGQPSELAVVSSQRSLAEEEEVIPRDEALALADYLLSLKRDYPLPVFLGGEPETSPAAAALAAPGGPAAPAAGQPGAPPNPLPPAAQPPAAQPPAAQPPAAQPPAAQPPAGPVPPAAIAPSAP